MAIDVDVIIKKIDEKLVKIHKLGVKGETLHSLIRGIAGILESRYSYKHRKHAHKLIEDDMAQHLARHEISKTETDLEKSTIHVVDGLSLLYLLLHNLGLFEKRGIQDLETIEHKFEVFLDHIGKKTDTARALRKTFEKAMKEIKDLWNHEELKKMRGIINDLHAETEGRSGGAFVFKFFEKAHKDGWFLYYQEKNLLKDIIKGEHVIEKLQNHIGKGFTSKGSINDWLEELKTDEKDLIEHFSKMHSLVFFTWELLIKDIDNLAKVAHKAATEHELPKLDDDSIEKIRITIVKKLCGEYFKNLQLIEIQLEHEAAKL